MNILNSPDISIITVTFNAERYIADCIKSLQNQELSAQSIFIDGGSEDSTVDIICKTLKRNDKVVSMPDEGIYHAMNKGIDLADNEIVGFLNADDFYADGKVLSRVSDVFSDSSVDACYADLDYISDKNPTNIVRRWKSGEYSLKKFYWGWMPPHPTFFVRKRIYTEYGLFRLELGSAADYELMLRFMVKYKLKTNYIPHTLVKMRVGGISNRSLKNRLLANRNDKRAWRINGLTPYPWTFLFKPIRKIHQWILS